MVQKICLQYVDPFLKSKQLSFNVGLIKVRNKVHMKVERTIYFIKMQFTQEHPTTASS